MSLCNVKMMVPLLVLFLPVALFAGRTKHETVDITAEGANQVVVNIEFGAGEIQLNSGNIDNIAKADIVYDIRTIDFDYEYEVNNGIGNLILESSHHKNLDIDTKENKWDVILSQNYPIRLDMEIGACEAEMDLGKLRLEELSMEVGATSAEINFSDPNPIRLNDIDIEAGAASLEMRNIGNANFEYFDFSGGVGSFDLDFRGKYSGESKITIELGLGSIDLILPHDVPVQIITEDSNWLSSIDFHHNNLEEIDDDVYESPNFAEAETRIIVEIEVGLGSVDLYWK